MRATWRCFLLRRRCALRSSAYSSNSRPPAFKSRRGSLATRASRPSTCSSSHSWRQGGRSPRQPRPLRCSGVERNRRSNGGSRRPSPSLSFRSRAFRSRFRRSPSAWVPASHASNARPPNAQITLSPSPRPALRADRGKHGGCKRLERETPREQRQMNRSGVAVANRSVTFIILTARSWSGPRYRPMAYQTTTIGPDQRRRTAS